MTVAVRRLGEENDTTIIFLHGGPGMDESYFFPYIEPLAKNFEIITFTQGNTGALDIDGLVEEVEDVVKQCGDKKIYILGHSFGSSLALEYLRRKPDRQSSLSGVILCTWYYDRDFIRPYLLKMRDHIKENNIKFESGFAPTTNEELKESSVKIVGMYFTKEFLEEGEKVFRKGQCNVDLYLSLEKNYLRVVDHKEFIPTISMPVLSMAATQDCIFDIEYVRAGLKLNPGFKHVEMDTGHFPFVENADTFCGLVSDFIGDLRNEET